MPYLVYGLERLLQQLAQLGVGACQPTEGSVTGVRVTESLTLREACFTVTKQSPAESTDTGDANGVDVTGFPFPSEVHVRLEGLDGKLRYGLYSMDFRVASGPSSGDLVLKNPVRTGDLSQPDPQGFWVVGLGGNPFRADDYTPNELDLKPESGLKIEDQA